MSLYMKPHLVRVYPPIGPVDPDTKIVQATTWGTEPSEVRCKLEPADIMTTFEKTGIELKRPYRLLAETADFATFAINARVISGVAGMTFTFRVIWRKRHDAFAITAHAEIMLEAEEFAQ